MRLRLAKSVGPKRLRVDGIAASTGPIARTVVISGTSSLSAIFSLSGVHFRAAAIEGVSTLTALASRTVPRTAAMASASTLAAVATVDSGEAAPDLSTLTVDNDAGTVSFTVDVACQVYLRARPTTDGAANAATIVAGGGIAAGNTAVTSGANDITLTDFFPADLDGTYGLDVVARVLPDGDFSVVRSANVIVDTTTPAPDEWDITPGETTATINDFPPAPTSPAWAITPAETTATITAYPGQP
jgi:hypothetical protein